MSQILFLHGASSSGKSTLARALQAGLPQPYWHLSIDHFRDSGAWPMDRFAQGDFVWADHRSTFFAGFHGCLAASAGAGNRLIVEHILDTPGWHADLQNSLSGFDVVFVGVLCPLDILEAREVARKDRPIGSARRDFETIHSGLTYDLTVDGTSDVAQAVTRIRDVLAQPDRGKSRFFTPSGSTRP